MKLRTMKFCRNLGVSLMFFGVLYYFLFHIGIELVIAVFGFVLFLIMSEIIWIRKNPRRSND
jgi:hypothetical protein